MFVIKANGEFAPFTWMFASCSPLRRDAVEQNKGRRAWTGEGRGLKSREEGKGMKGEG